MTTRITRFDRGPHTFDVTDEGPIDGEPIVLLHGLMGSGRTWGRQVPWLRAFGQVYVVDAVGHRGARESRAVPTTDDFVDDLVDVLGEFRPRVVRMDTGSEDV